MKRKPRCSEESIRKELFAFVRSLEKKYGREITDLNLSINYDRGDKVMDCDLTIDLQ